METGGLPLVTDDAFTKEMRLKEGKEWPPIPDILGPLPVPEGLSYKEIAKKTNCKPGTVMSRIFNARKAIQSQMKEFLK